MRALHSSRRAFLGLGARLAGGGLLSLGALSRLGARTALAAGGGNPAASGYGPLAPVSPANDPAGPPVLALPRGFSYVKFSAIGERMSDGNPVPTSLDGMAAFAHQTEARLVRLVRNHEDGAQPARGSVLGPAATRYDANARGGTTTLDYDEAARTLVRHFISLNGTRMNCAGGVGYGRRSFLTCEETTVSAGSGAPPGWAKNHGYVFEVPLHLPPNTTAPAVPLPALGRFAHEAAAVDQETGIVYLTEDATPGVGSGFYRFLPKDPAGLLAGGRLQMLGIRNSPQHDLREGQRIGRSLPVVWCDIADPDPAHASNDSPERVFEQGSDRGGAMFHRLEGCWWDGGRVFFASTGGGDAKTGVLDFDGFAEGFGQIWEYRAAGPAEGHLTLVFESPGAQVLESPDNLVVTPRGGLLLCEDDMASKNRDTHPLAPGLANVNRLIGLTVTGQVFEFAVNRLNASELAGACFSPSGRTLFVNIYGTGAPASGMTLAITGPWGSDLL